MKNKPIHNAIMYKRPLLAQSKNECWLVSSAMGCSDTLNDAKHHMSKIKNIVDTSFPNNMFIKDGVPTDENDKFRKSLNMREIKKASNSSDLRAFYNDQLKKEEEYNLFHDILAKEGPFILSATSPFNERIKHQTLITGAILITKNDNKKELFIVQNNSQPVLEAGGKNKSALEAVPSAMLKMDPNIELYTLPEDFNDDPLHSRLSTNNIETSIHNGELGFLIKSDIEPKKQSTPRISRNKNTKYGNTITHKTSNIENKKESICPQNCVIL